jgi:ABC-type transporter Mla subunit MlaD
MKSYADLISDANNSVEELESQLESIESAASDAADYLRDLKKDLESLGDMDPSAGLQEADFEALANIAKALAHNAEALQDFIATRSRS